MSLPNNRGVSRSRRARSWCIQMVILNGSTKYPILLRSALLPFLSTQFWDLSTRRFLLSSNVIDILPIHSRSSTTSEPEWRMQWWFLMWLPIHSFSAFWRASGPIIPCLMRCRLRGGGVRVHGSSSRLLFFEFCII